MSDLTKMVNFKTLEFTWGTFIEIYYIANFQIVEFEDDHTGNIDFHIFVNEVDTHQAHPSLKKAIVGAIAFEKEGHNSLACEYFFRMIGETKCQI